MSFGPVIHNESEKGYSSEVAEIWLDNQDRLIAQLNSLRKKYEWTALNLDFESLEPSLKGPFSKFVYRLSKVLGPYMRISVAVHPKTKSVGFDHIGYFQDVDFLGKLPVDIVVMAYDHAWATSPPGLIAPASWYAEVCNYFKARTTASRFIMGIGAYGYMWQREKNMKSWKADGLTLKQIKAFMDGLALREKSQIKSSKDGSILNNIAGKSLAWENTQSITWKMKKIRQCEKEAGVAIWKIPNLTSELWQRISKVESQ